MAVDVSVAEGGVGTRRRWLSVGDLGRSGNTGLFSKIPESRELNRARESVPLIEHIGSGAVSNCVNDV